MYSTQQHKSSTEEDRTLRRNKRHSDLIPSPENTRPAKSRKRKKRRQNKKKKERLRNRRRSSRKLKKRRRLKLIGKKITNSSLTSSTSPTESTRLFHLAKGPHTQGQPSKAPPSTHNAQLVELLTGGNKRFLIPRSNASKDSTEVQESSQRLIEHPHTKRLIFLPLKIMSGGGLEWLPYNPDIRVSIQVTGDHHYDLTESTTRQPSSQDTRDHQGKLSY